MSSKKSPKIVLIGGGTGSFTLLQELKRLTPNLSAVVNMSDDGGSTGVLRDELDVLPPGDIRQCLVALSDLAEVRDLFNYRFGGDGDLSGHSLGNLILAGLEQRYNDFSEAIRVASSLLQITGKVIPVSLEKHILVMNDGAEIIKGEYSIAHRPIKSPRANVYLQPNADLNPRAKQVILEADMIVIAPGNLYGSLLPAIVVNGLAEALEQSSAKKVMVSNLITKPGQTDGWHVADYVKAIEKYLGNNAIDTVLYNDSAPSKELLIRYAADKEFPVKTDKTRFKEISAKAIGADLLAKVPFQQDPNDKAISRTLIRHDAHQVCQELLKIIDSK